MQSGIPFAIAFINGFENEGFQSQNYKLAINLKQQNKINRLFKTKERRL